MSAAASSSSPSPYRLTFERAVWVGSYKTAKELKENSGRFRHLSDECAICLEKFKELEAVFILVCEHGFHKTCYEKWDKQPCPMDRVPVDLEAVKNITCLGQTILFPNKTRKFGAWIVSQREEFQAGWERGDKDIPPDIQSNLKKIPIIQTFLQEAIDIYEGLVPEGEIPKRGQAVLALMRELLVDPSFRIFYNSTVLPKISALRGNSIWDDLRMVAEAESEQWVYKETNLHIDIQGVKALLSFFSELSQGKRDLTFFEEHLKILEVFSDSQQADYLSNLDSASFARLQQLTPMSDPLCKKLQKQMGEIKQSRNNTKFFLFGVALALLSKAYFYWTASGKE